MGKKSDLEATADLIARLDGKGRNALDVHLPGVPSLWALGWLFTLGYAHLDLWRGLLALLIWPYFAGGAAS